MENILLKNIALIEEPSYRINILESSSPKEPIFFLLTCILENQNKFLDLEKEIINYIYSRFILSENEFHIKKSNCYFIFLIKKSINDINKNAIENNQTLIKKYIIDNYTGTNNEDLKETLKTNLPCLAPIKEIVKQQVLNKEDVNKDIIKSLKKSKKFKNLKSIFQTVELNELKKMSLNKILEEVENENKID